MLATRTIGDPEEVGWVGQMGPRSDTQSPEALDGCGLTIRNRLGANGPGREAEPIFSSWKQIVRASRGAPCRAKPGRHIALFSGRGKCPIRRALADIWPSSAQRPRGGREAAPKKEGRGNATQSETLPWGGRRIADKGLRLTWPNRAVFPLRGGRAAVISIDCAMGGQLWRRPP